MDLKLRAGILISGRGSNLQALIDASKKPDFPVEIACVISNKADAYGLERAQNASIPTAVISHLSYNDKIQFEEALTQKLQELRVDLICLAGFMRILTSYFISQWEGRILNIHPSLLPKYKGLDTHARALLAKDKHAGCSVHLVTEGLDDGPVLLQRSVPIYEQDTPSTLAARVLEAEHIAYPEALKIMADRLIGR